MTTPKTDGLNYDYTVLPQDETTSIDDVEPGERYWGIVNGVESYGAFVTVANLGHREAEVTGLAHHTCMPNMYRSDDYEPGDQVGVMVVNRDEGDRPNFEVVAHIDCVRLDREEFEPRSALHTETDEEQLFDPEKSHIEVPEPLQDDGSNTPSVQVEVADPEPDETWGEYRKQEVTRAVQMPVSFAVETAEGRMTAEAGDYLALDVNDDPYPIAQDVFEATYEGVNADG